MPFLCYVNGRADPTQFFYNMVVLFDTTPDLYSLRRAIEQQANEDGVCCDGSEFIVSDIEILDFRINQWINLEARSQLYSGCFLTAIRDTATSTCAGAVDTTSRSHLQRVLGFAVHSQRLFEALDVDGDGVLRMKGLIRVLRHDLDYAVEVFSTLDPEAEGVVTYQQFVTMFHVPTNRDFFAELKERIEHGGRRVLGPSSSPASEHHNRADCGDDGQIVSSTTALDASSMGKPPLTHSPKHSFGTASVHTDATLQHATDGELLLRGSTSDVAARQNHGESSLGSSDDERRTSPTSARPRRTDSVSGSASLTTDAQLFSRRVNNNNKAGTPAVGATRSGSNAGSAEDRATTPPSLQGGSQQSSLTASPSASFSTQGRAASSSVHFEGSANHSSTSRVSPTAAVASGLQVSGSSASSLRKYASTAALPSMRRSSGNSPSSKPK